MSRRLAELAPRRPELDPERRRALDQAGRELLLAQASDWAFLMTVGTAKPFAQRQVKDHIRDFFKCEGWARSGGVDGAALAEIEERDRIFPDIDVSAFANER
jgi:1,4-alpha-glucan branching enzyme